MAEKRYAGLNFDEVVQKYAQTVTGVCVMRLKSYHDAEDCFQNTFFKLYRSQLDFQNEKHLKAWLIRVAVNECNDFLRRQNRLAPLEALESKTITLNTDALDASDALLKLEPKYREVLYLHYIERYKTKEIADILDLNPNTVKTNLKRGRDKLRKNLGGDKNE
ncbi:MAG: sigma-70 family RNA polymerase sigma factor [Ruminococcus sp.]|nr:sigma-70 family RNA polymerase sigma factor [Ruminococcus sp.]